MGEPAVNLTETLVVKDGNVFLVAPRDGRLPADLPHALGLWFMDCRFLSVHELTLGGEPLRLLTASDAAGTIAVHEFANADASLHVRVTRSVHAGGALRERIVLRNHGRAALRVPLELRLGADFLPMLEVRGIVGPHERPPPSFDRDGFSAVGRDGVRRSTSIATRPAPDSSHGGRLAFDLELPLRGEAQVELDLELREGEAGPRRPGPASRPDGGGVRARADGDGIRVRSDDRLFDRILERSLDDLRLLRSRLGVHSYYAAGVPWFVTLFGRDSLITAFQTLAFSPGVAEGTLRLLAANLGREHDDPRDEEPGKVVHELRVGEPAALGETAFARYYGSADATPLFLCLLCVHADWSGSLDLFRELRAPAEAALEWIDRHGDLDGDGLVEYRRRAAGGLLTQGWKDSPCGAPDDAGEPLEPPVALVEVQGYALRAKLLMARMLELDGDGARAERLRADAAELERALERFWLAEPGCYALGLDAAKRPGTGLASNQGHLLWMNAVGAERARRIRDVLMGDDMFSGWGIRTLGQSHPAYNPLGYHTGSVWPHDSALIACGLRRYGFDEDFGAIFEGLLEAASRFDDYRLPELFAGFPRGEPAEPVPYPVACRPQAWAAGSIPLLLTCGLGLEPDARGRKLRIARPSLPPWVDRIELSGLALGEARIDLRFERAGDVVTLADADVRGDVEVFPPHPG